jgi:hypothetical protein
MKIDPDLIQQTLGIVGVCVSESYKTPIAFAEALERVAANARRRHAEQLAASGIITQKGDSEDASIG